MNLRGVFVFFRNIGTVYLINIGWIRIRDPELLPGSGSGTRIIQIWIRIRNKSFRIHNTALSNVAEPSYCWLTPIFLIPGAENFSLGMYKWAGCCRPSLRMMMKNCRPQLCPPLQMFGKEFWENAILEATHWNYGSDNIR